MEKDFDERMARVAVRQHGLVTRAQVLEAGGTRHHIESRLRSGQWTAVGRGLYRITGARHTWHTQLLAGCLLSAGVASHRSAAVLWGLDGFREGGIDVTIPRGSGFRHDRVRVHQSTDLHLDRSSRREGIPVTGINRTLLDLGAVIPADRLEDTVFDAINRRLTDWSSLGDAFTRHRRRGRSGVAAMASLFDATFGSKVTESKLESILARSIVEWHLPAPERQVEVHDDRGFVARLDFGYPQWRLGAETDGRSVHARRQALDVDHHRRNLIKLAGWDLLVFTADAVLRRPEAVRRQLAVAITQARARAAA